MTVLVSGQGQQLSSDKKFLEAHTVTEGLTVKVQGKGGVSASGVKDVTVTYKLDVDGLTTNNKTSAGYFYEGSSDATLKSNLTSNGTVTVTLMENPSNKNEFILDADSGMTLPLMGTYKLDKVTFKIGNTIFATTASEGHTTVPLNANSVAPSYTYEWDAPIVKITGVKPSGNVEANNSKDVYNSYRKYNLVNVKNEKSDFACTVYFSAVIEYRLLTQYTLPEVTTKLSNVSTFNSASMTVVASGTADGVAVSGKGSDVEFSFSSSEDTSTQTVGSMGSNLRTNRYPIGKNSKATHITITGKLANGTPITYVFKLDNAITINNPY
jgi:hypothetical protein